MDWVDRYVHVCLVYWKKEKKWKEKEKKISNKKERIMIMNVNITKEKKIRLKKTVCKSNELNYQNRK